MVKRGLALESIRTSESNFGLGNEMKIHTVCTLNKGTTSERWPPFFPLRRSFKKYSAAKQAVLYMRVKAARYFPTYKLKNHFINQTIITHILSMQQLHFEPLQTFTQTTGKPVNKAR